MLYCVPSKQRSTLLPRTATMSNDSIVKFRPFDKVDTNWTCSICLNWTCSICFDIVERIVQLVAFDNVASTLLLVWTGLYRGGRARRSGVDRRVDLCRRLPSWYVIYHALSWMSVQKKKFWTAIINSSRLSRRINSVTSKWHGAQIGALSTKARTPLRYFLALTCCRDIFGQNHLTAQPQSINRLCSHATLSGSNWNATS